MPTKVQRLNVTITEEQRALLMEMAKLEGMSASRFVRGMIDKVTPMLRIAVPMLREAAKKNELAQEDADRLLGRIFREATEASQLDLLDGTGLGSSGTTNATQRERSSEAVRRSAASPSGSSSGNDE